MGKNQEEEKYIKKRLRKAGAQSILFYLFRVFPINKRKIVITTIEGTTGFSCNPKYLALELLKRNRNLPKEQKWKIFWLVNDESKAFPDGIIKKKNTLWNRAYHLTTAHFWIDNSRKQLEARKRKGQVYIQTWHAKLGFKPTCLDRGASFSRIAYLVSKHDSDMVDYWLSNSDWYDGTMKTGSIYEGEMLRTGSPRCDILVNRSDTERNSVRERLRLDKDVKLIMYAPTFRGGSQSVDREISTEDANVDYERLIQSLEKRFGGEWYILLRLHPQLVARHIESGKSSDRTIDISREDDMYEILAGCDAFLTDYSSAAFDAAVMKIPVFLYCDDYKDYEGERGKLLWDLRKLPFPLAENNVEMEEVITGFDESEYSEELRKLFEETGMEESGDASKIVADFIEKID